VRPTFYLKTIPVNKSASTITEFGDIQLFDLLVSPWPNPELTAFRWGVGPYFVFPMASDRQAGDGA
jgi:hypothetical protein